MIAKANQRLYVSTVVLVDIKV